MKLGMLSWLTGGDGRSDGTKVETHTTVRRGVFPTASTSRKIW